MIAIRQYPLTGIVASVYQTNIMTTIVAPTNFSAPSINAVYYAADLACTMNAKLDLLHVYSIPVSFTLTPSDAFSFDELESNAEKQISSLKTELESRTKGKIVIESHVKEGDAYIEIEDYCNKTNPFVVVMGPETEGRIERLLFGGVTTEAIKDARFPLIFVPADTRFTPFKKIGLACDVRDIDDTVHFEEIKALVSSTKAEFHMLHICNQDDFDDTDVKEATQIKGVLRELNPQYHFIRDTRTASAVNYFATLHQLDLLIVIPKKHSLLGNIFHRSHAKKIVLHSHIPVMSLHE
jgi:nucleotide-binding universal stress UspA family protein